MGRGNCSEIIFKCRRKISRFQVHNLREEIKTMIEDVVRKTVIKERARLCKKQPGTFTLIGGCNIIISEEHDT